MPQEGQLVAQRLEQRPEVGLDEQHAGAAVVEHVEVVLRAQLGVQWHGDGADLDRAEEGAGELRRVVEQHTHALLQLDAERPQRVPRPVDALREVAVRPVAAGARMAIRSPQPRCSAPSTRSTATLYCSGRASAGLWTDDSEGAGGNTGTDIGGTSSEGRHRVLREDGAGARRRLALACIVHPG